MRGFTLIEVLLYLALYAILMAGILSAVYSLFESSDRDATSAMVEEEGDFLIGKILWSLSGASSIDEPNGSGDELVVSRTDGSIITIWSEAGHMRIQESNDTLAMLNNDAVSVSDLSFVRQSSGVSENIETSFTLHATTSAGLPLSRHFSALDYLQQ